MNAHLFQIASALASALVFALPLVAHCDMEPSMLLKWLLEPQQGKAATSCVASAGSLAGHMRVGTTVLAVYTLKLSLMRKHDDAGHIMRVCQVLASFGKSARHAAPEITRLMAAPDARIRLAAVRAYTAMGNDQSVLPLIQMLEGESNCSVAFEGVRCLLSLQGESGPIRVRIVNGMLRIARRHIAKEFEECFSGELVSDIDRSYMRALLSDNAFAVIVNQASDGVPTLCKTIGDGSEDWRIRAGSTLALGRIANRLQKPTDTGQGAIFRRCLAAVVSLTKDPKTELRIIAVRSLEGFGAEARPHLEGVIGRDAENKAVREAAAASLERLSCSP